MLEQTVRPAGWRRLVAGAGALALGAFVGSVTTVVHQSDIDVAGISVPWGMILGLLAVAGFLIGLRIVVQDRLVVIAGALGIVVLIFILSQRSPGGSVLVPNNLWGSIWAIAPTLIAAIVVAWPKLPPRSRGANSGSSSAR